MEITDDDMQIERRIGELIDRGLECYGAGDMEGALSQWKHALALDPENERAANYLEYVEEHHDLNPGGKSGATVELDYPFGISTLGLAKLSDEELDDYESFEIVDTAAKEPAARERATVDDGWTVDEGWVADLVQKSETAFTPSPPAGPSSDPEATVDVSLAIDLYADSSEETQPLDTVDPPTDVKEEVQTHVHRPSAKVRSLAGFDELELDTEGEEEHTPEQEEEEEPTHALLGERPTSGTRSARLAANELELDPEEEDQEEEERTGCHDSANRVGVSHTAATSDFADLELDGMGLGELGGGTEASIPSLPALPSEDAIGDGEATIDFDDNPASEEISISGLDEPEDLDSLGEASGGEVSDRSETSKHFAIDEEMTIDRSSMANRPPHSRAPTQDHGISEASIRIDDALLSLQDSTRELDLGDMGLALPGDESEDQDGADEAELEEVDIRIGRSSELETAPGENLQEQEFARHDSATESKDDGFLAEVTRDAPRDDLGERVLYIVRRLIDHADEEFVEGRGAAAAADVCHALDYASDSAVAQKIIFENERRLVQILISSLGDAGQIPRLLCPLSEIPAEHINHRAAFLLTRLEQALTLDELLDVSGMPKLEALSHLCALHVLNYLEVV